MYLLRDFILLQLVSDADCFFSPSLFVFLLLLLRLRVESPLVTFVNDSVVVGCSADGTGKTGDPFD